MAAASEVGHPAPLDLHPRVSVSGVSTFSWTLAQDIEFWRSSGMTRVGVLLQKLEPEGLEAGAAALAEADLVAANVVGGFGFSVARPERWEEERAAMRRGVDAAAALSSPCLCTLLGRADGLESEAAVDAWGEAAAPVLDYAAQRGVVIALEHVAGLRRQLGFVHTVADAVDMAKAIGTGVCVELNNAWVEMHLPATFRRGAKTFALVQVSDFVIGTNDIPNRAVPGDGDIPLERLLGWLLEAGYGGMFDLEVIGPRIEAEGYASAVRRGAAWLSDTLDRLGA